MTRHSHLQHCNYCDTNDTVFDIMVTYMKTVVGIFSKTLAGAAKVG